MHLTLLVAGALLPGKMADALSASLDTPNLKSRLSRAASIEPGAYSASQADRGDAHLDWLARKLFGHAAPAPTAPYAYAHLAGARPHAFIWHADPVHVEPARDHLIVQSLGADAPTPDESQQLIRVANEPTSDLGCELVSVDHRWFLLSEHDWAIDSIPLAAVIEAPAMMPVGRNAQIWNRLHNEIQMAWHTHPVNEARQTNRMPTINALWLHGGGRWKPLPKIEYAQVQSDAPEWQGAAHAAGARGLPLGANIVDNALLVIDGALLSRRIEDWAGWLHAMTTIDRRLAAHASDTVDFVLAGKTVHTYASQPSDRYKPWRRRTLAAALTE